MALTKDRCIKRHAQLLQERSTWDSHWKEIADFLAPRLARFLGQQPNNGSKVNTKILDNTPLLALRLLQSGMMAGMTSPARNWFKKTTNDEALNKLKAVKIYLDEVEQRMRAVFLKSNLYNVLPLMYGSAAAFGVAAMAVLEDDESVIRCYPFAIGSYCLACGPTQQVDTCYREFPYTVGQTVREFGRENCSTAVQALYDAGNTETWVNIVHAIEPNIDRDSTQLDAKNKKWISVYYEKGVSGSSAAQTQSPTSSDNKFLRVSGYDEFPVIAPRWQASADGDVYSTCPGMEALGDIKQLQHQTKRALQAIDKLVNPPLIADASIRSQRTSLLPGELTYIPGLSNSAGAGLRPVYTIDPHLQELNASIAQVSERIKKTFFSDVMQLFAGYDGPAQTATEVTQKAQDRLLSMGPVLEKLDEELLDKLIERTYAIMNRKGLLPKPPRELIGKPLTVQYVSIMAQAQKLIGTAGIERLAGFIGNLAGAAPAVLDKVNWDAAVDSYADMLGVPANIILTDEEVAATRQQKAAQAAGQAQLDSMPNLKQGAEAAQTMLETAKANPAAAQILAQAGSSSGAGEPSALQRLLGQ